MDPLKKKLASLAAEAAKLREKAQNTPDEFTEEDATRATEVLKEHAETAAKIERAREVSEQLNSFAAEMDAPQSSQDNDATGARGAVKGKTLGERFVNSQVYKDHRAAYPTGPGKGTPFSIKTRELMTPREVSKATPLTTGGAGNAAPVRTTDVDDLVYRPARRLLELVTKGTTNQPWIQYRQVISKTNNAAIVPEASTTDPIDGTTVTAKAGGLKPLSTLTTTTAEAKAFTYADGMEVTNQELSDDGIIKTLIDATLRENLDIYTEDILLNGAGNSDEPAGILNTSGVLQQAFAVDAQTTLRKAITKLTTTSGANIRGVLLNPEDDEAWDLLKDLEGRYLHGGGPYSQGPKTAWGYERIVSPAIEVGQAVIGDFSTIHLLTYEGLTVEAFNQHKDYAQRNLAYIRAEFRALQLIRNAARLCVVDLTA